MVNTDLSLEEALEIIRTETITHGNDKVRVIDVLYMLAGMKGGSGEGASVDNATKKKIDNILKMLSSDDENFDTLQELVDGLKDKLETDFSNLPESISEEVKERFKALFDITSGATAIEPTISGNDWE